MQSFQIQIPQETLDDLRQRLTQTRWTDEVTGADWDYGTNRTYLKELVNYWQTEFDWRAQEAALNQFPQFLAEVDGVNLHFIHARSKEPNALPIVLLHGWPGSFYQMTKLLPLLTDPAAHGGVAADAFDVVVPSLPGYGFSERPGQQGMTVSRMAEVFDALMTTTLGYPRYAAEGSDLGAGVAAVMVNRFPEHVVGLQSNGGNPRILDVPDDLTPAEQEFVKKTQAWMQGEGAYAMLHATKPQTLAYGLNDSPVGLAAWLVEKYRSWSDCHGDVETRFSKNELLTFVTLYWVTGTIGSSIRLYYESNREPQNPKDWKPTDVPLALAVYPGDIAVPPREWVERTTKLARFTVMPKGGHFAEWEEPNLLAEELRTFFRDLR